MAMMEKRAISRVQTLAESGIQTVPPEFVRQVEKALVQEDLHVPIIDLHSSSLLPQHHDQITDNRCTNFKRCRELGFLPDYKSWRPGLSYSRVQAAARLSSNFPLKERKPTLTNQKIPSAMAANSDIRQMERLYWTGETITLTVFGLLPGEVANSQGWSLD
jgi:hypothetical protein